MPPSGSFYWRPFPSRRGYQCDGGRRVARHGDGLLISIVGPLFTWLVAVPAAYVMAFILDWGIFGILLSAVLDEGCRSYFYWRRWRTERWQHTHVHALEAKAERAQVQQ